MSSLLEQINSPADLRRLSGDELGRLAAEIRDFIVSAVAVTGGHLGSNLGAVELTLAVHRVFDSPRDIVLWDTGHQAYVHKLVTGRRKGFARLRQADGLSGYPCRSESDHDWIENSHASTVLSYAHGVATAVARSAEPDRQVVAIIGDGAMTGGMAYEALNNLGHSGRRVLVILNDNGRSYSPTVSRLSESLSRLRLNPAFVQRRRKLERTVRRLPGALGGFADRYLQSVKAGFREALEPPAFFECLGVRYTGPIDGHDVEGMEQAFTHAATYDGPIVVHVRTQKGRGYPPAEDDDEKNLHDVSVFDPLTGPVAPTGPTRTYTDVFTGALLAAGERHPDLVALSAAMPGPTGLLPFALRWPDRMFDVGIAEQHMVTAAAGMAMGGLRPVVAVYSTFFSRAFDQANLDVGLHAAPVVFCMDRAGITGDDGASHHGILDLSLCLRIPGMTVFAPSSAQELAVMFGTALILDGPAAIRYPKGVAREVDPGDVGEGLAARRLRAGSDVCILAVGKLVEAGLQAADHLAEEGIAATVWDARVVAPLDEVMIADAATHPLVVTAEDGVRLGGAGQAMVDAIAALDEGANAPPALVLGVPRTFIPQAKPARILAELGLDGPGIATAIRKALAASAG